MLSGVEALAPRAIINYTFLIINSSKAMFTTTAKQYITMLIAIRKKLIRLNKNQANAAKLATLIQQLGLYLTAYTYDNHQMAGFWLKHRHEIQELVPGSGARNHETLQQQFNQLDQQATEIRQSALSPIINS